MQANLFGNPQMVARVLKPSTAKQSCPGGWRTVSVVWNVASNRLVVPFFVIDDLNITREYV